MLADGQLSHKETKVESATINYERLQRETSETSNWVKNELLVLLCLIEMLCVVGQVPCACHASRSTTYECQKATVEYNATKTILSHCQLYALRFVRSVHPL